MTKPEDIPQQVWDNASRVFTDTEWEQSKSGCVQYIARAIMAAKAREREDIWAIASGNAVGERYLERMARASNDAEGARLHALLASENEHLADAIRNRDTV